MIVMIRYVSKCFRKKDLLFMETKEKNKFCLETIRVSSFRKVPFDILKN